MSDPIAQAINEQKSKVKQYIIPTLEDFIYLCYPELNIADDKFNNFIVNEGNLTKQVSELEYQLQFNPFDFKQFVIQSHCEENLEFLIDIHKYELLWNKKFNENSNYLSCYPKRVFINESEFNNFKNKKQSFPVSSTSINNTNNDINNDNNSDNNNNNNSNGSSVDDLNSIRDLSLDSDDSDGSISAFWSHIIDLYIRDTSLDQINIPSEILQSILTEDKKSRRHKPKVLLTAKKLILSLLRQNVYWEFIRHVQSRIERNPTLHGPCGVSNNASSNDSQTLKSKGPESLLDNWDSVYLDQHKFNKDVKKPTGFFRFYAKNFTDLQHNKNNQTPSTVNLSPITNTISNSSSIISQPTSPSSLTMINSNSNKANLDEYINGNNVKHKKGLFSSSLSKLSKIRPSHRPSSNSNSNSSTHSSSLSLPHHYSLFLNHSSPNQSITISPPRHHISDPTNQHTQSHLQTQTQAQTLSPGGSPLASPNFYTTTTPSGAFKLCRGQSDKTVSSNESIKIPRRAIPEPKEYTLDKGKISKDNLTQDVKKFRS